MRSSHCWNARSVPQCAVAVARVLVNGPSSRENYGRSGSPCPGAVAARARGMRATAAVAAALVAACSGGDAEIGSSGPIDGGAPPNDAASSVDGSVTPDPANNSPLCPSAKPAGGTGCPSVDLVCYYASGCAVPSKATCSGAGTWGVSIPDCATQCPSTVPVAASKCSVPRLECEYGADARPWCRDRAACTLTSTATNETVWNVGKDNSVYSTGAGCTGAAPACPAASPSTDDACTEPNLCTYQTNGVSCVCYDRNAGCGACETTNFRWTCAPLPAAPCPSTPPNVGTACVSDGVSCTYGKCGTLAARTVTCGVGAWKRSTEPCK